MFQQCEDTEGSYRCRTACEKGYVVDDTTDIPSCIDDNECGRNPCNSITELCTNSIGESSKSMP